MNFRLRLCPPRPARRGPSPLAPPSRRPPHQHWPPPAPPQRCDTAANGDSNAAAPAPGARPAGAPAAAGAPPAPKPFADVSGTPKKKVRASSAPGARDDKVVEIPEAMWDRPFFFSGQRHPQHR